MIQPLPIAKLLRTYGDTQTDGVLTFGNSQIHTIERPKLTPMVPGIYCQEEGDYTCTWSFMPSHNVWHYKLEDMHGRIGIFIHIGMKVTDSKGCILSDRPSIALLESWLQNHGSFLLKIRS